MSEVQKLKKKDFVSDQDIRWCPECGDYTILNTVQKVFPDLGIPKHQFLIVSGIGCSSRFPYYMNCYGFHSIHGRAPAVATGAKLSNPDLSVWVITGDGDAMSIGGNHFISEMIEVCAGTNVFSELEQLAPSVSVESVIARDPQVIMSMAKAKSQSNFQYWKKFGNLSANKYDNFYYLHSDALERPTTRIISAGEELCKKLEEARLKLETTVKN